MAKSIRSKRMRKLRAFKRIRYGEKELIRLKNMLQKAAEEEKLNPASDPSNSYPVTSSTTMETDDQDIGVKVTKPPKYPCWLSNFKIKKLAKIEKKSKKKEAKRLKKQKKAELKKNKKNKNK